MKHYTHTPKALTFKKALSRALAAKRELLNAESDEHRTLAQKNLKAACDVAYNLAFGEADLCRVNNVLDDSAE
jgi:hypothetical protein